MACQCAFVLYGAEAFIIDVLVHYSPIASDQQGWRRGAASEKAMLSSASTSNRRPTSKHSTRQLREPPRNIIHDGTQLFLVLQ